MTFEQLYGSHKGVIRQERQKEAVGAWREQKELRLKRGSQAWLGREGSKMKKDNSYRSPLEQEMEVVSKQWARILQSWQVQAVRILPTWPAKVTWLLS